MPAPEPAPSYEVTASGPAAEGGWTITLQIPAGTPLCDGHFPGKPIVPGVAQLTLVERALGEWRGGADSRREGLAGIPSLRLRQPVVPGDELDVWVREGERGAVVFEVRCGGVLVANGTGARGAPHLMRDAPLLASPRTQPPPPRGEGRFAGAGEPVGTFPPVEELVPHRGPMLLVREVLAADPGSLTARAMVSPSHPLVSSGSAPAWLSLEAAAQAAALHEALARVSTAPAASGPRLGYLVSVRDAALSAPFPAGAGLLAMVHAAGSAGGLASYEVEVVLEADGRPVARGRLGTFAME